MHLLVLFYWVHINMYRYLKYMTLKSKSWLTHMLYSMYCFPKTFLSKCRPIGCVFCDSLITDRK